ncbi:MAG TPA: class I SAM-dependent methyltransferase, partial [Acidobacteriota bacterium]|nr:class I SAM-dependent methyltransferase [Acidobacteriota bacterium]
RFISEQVSQGVDMVVNLAAGLDARPYRMNLPSDLKWVEVDLPELLAYKEDILRNEKPVCALERIAVNLADVTVRRTVFNKLKQQASRVLIVSEGLLVYLTEEEVGALAQDLASAESFERWVIDIISPGLLRYMQKKVGKQLDEAKAPLKFAPQEGPEFFAKYGWPPIHIRSMLKAASKAKRLPFWMRLLAMLPDSNGKAGNRPWSGVCLLGKA